jgi:LemA protein
MRIQPALIVLGVGALLILIWAIGNFNILIRLRQHVRESWAGIDTELKRRYDLIPNLVATVKGYAAHEREVFERIVEARSRAMASVGSPASQARDENELIGSLGRLLAVVERYPDLKASEQFLRLQEELTTTEDRIQRARRFYNANVRDLNTRVEQFPSNVIASMMGIACAEFFEIEDASERRAVTVAMG